MFDRGFIKEDLFNEIVIFTNMNSGVYNSKIFSSNNLQKWLQAPSFELKRWYYKDAKDLENGIEIAIVRKQLKYLKV